MNIVKSTRNINVIVFKIPKVEYEYWFVFCDYFIDKCTKIIEENTLSAKTIQNFQFFKESLEKLLFTVDVNREDENCSVEFPSTFLSLIQSLMQKWNGVLKKEWQQNQIKLQMTKNGENKRQLNKAQDHIHQVFKYNLLMIEQIKTYKEAS